ncbi:MAG: helix-turn-helix domain-containing protein [Caecibacter massiliensis]|nr:helix-turn-helix domain-containing protein [Caecibacter massiliensis]
MFCNLADILRKVKIPQIRLLTLPQDFTHREVTGISVQEMPIDDFIKKNYIILSTAIGYQKNPEIFHILFEKAIAAQAAAIILSFKDQNFMLPQSALDYANSKQLPVFVMPWNVHFADVQNDVWANIKEKEIAKYKDLQSRLCSLFFENKTLQDAALLLAKVLHGHVQITSVNGKILAEKQFLSNQSVPQQTLKEDIVISDTHFASLLLTLPGEEKGNSFHALPADWQRYILFPLSLWFNRKCIEDNLSMQIKDKFVHNLAHGINDSHEDMVQQGLYLSFNLNLPYACLLLKICPASGEPVPVPKHYEESLKQQITVKQILLETGHRLNRRTILTNDNQIFIIYLENKEPAGKIIDTYIAETEKHLASFMPQQRFYWGISDISSEQPCNFVQKYKNASFALQYCQESQTSCYRFTYKDTKKSLILSTLSQDEKIRNQARETLLPLFTYKENSGIELFHTLVTYLKANYNVSQTARDLHIHRQSLLYRLEKIENLTQMDLSNHDDLFILEVYSHLYHT